MTNGPIKIEPGPGRLIAAWDEPREKGGLTYYVTKLHEDDLEILARIEKKLDQLLRMAP